MVIGGFSMPNVQADLSEGFFAEIHEKEVSTNFVLEKHLHKYHEIYLLLEGNTKYFVNNEIINLNKNEAAFVKSGYIHKASYDNARYSKRMLICFTTEFIGERYLGMLNLLGKRKLLSFNDSELFNAFLKIYTEFENKEHQYLEQCRNLLRGIIIELSRLQDSPATQQLSNNEALIQSAAKYISSHLNENLSLHTLAKICAMSDSYFSRTFKQYTGLGVSKYIKLKRLQKAEKLLVLNKYTITEIAFDCGFNDSNYFISEFKKHRGITPLQFAKMSRENQ